MLQVGLVLLGLVVAHIVVGLDLDSAPVVVDLGLLGGGDADERLGLARVVVAWAARLVIATAASSGLVVGRTGEVAPVARVAAALAWVGQLLVPHAADAHATGAHAALAARADQPALAARGGLGRPWVGGHALLQARRRAGREGDAVAVPARLVAVVGTRARRRLLGLLLGWLLAQRLDVGRDLERSDLGLALLGRGRGRLPPVVLAHAHALGNRAGFGWSAVRAAGHGRPGWHGLCSLRRTRRRGWWRCAHRHGRSSRARRGTGPAWRSHHLRARYRWETAHGTQRRRGILRLA